MLLFGFCIALIIPAALAGAYYFLLTVVAMLPYTQLIGTNERRLRFSIVIPAHNEEYSIKSTLAACRRLNYPTELFHCVVVADNCSDRTAGIARGAGADVLERRDLSRFGKGYALAWALPCVIAENPDAVVVLDADCRPSANLLSEMSRAFIGGADVVQSKVVVSNPDATPASCFAALGNCLENDFFCTPKNRLGLAIFLRGTGMAFRRELLEDLPWSATSAVEDHEYGLQVLQRGKRVRFLETTSVDCPALTSSRAVGIQRRRWANTLRGSIAVAHRFAIDGIRQRSLLLFDAALTQLVSSRPLVLAELIVATLVSVVCYRQMPSRLSLAALLICATITLVHVFCLFVGFVRLGPSVRRVMLLASAGPSIFRLLTATFRGIFGRPASWFNTRRVIGSGIAS